ncbi:hypothetical protein R3P38DRAFT_2495534 [Favolaschia claudopus]|uniref:Uncharacterized protein n=1 Tax=Favolaschia claudopus TaxID=2862362 RepID=A0AAW0E775_9AGAR
MLTENLSCSASPVSKPVAAPLDLVDQQRLSLFILTCRNRSIPSCESMKAFVESSETSGRDPTGIVETRIQELSDQYGKDVENLYAAIAEDYMDEMEDRYLSFEERLPSGVKMEEDDKSDLRNSERSISREWYHALDTTTATFHARIDALSRHRNLHKNSERDMLNSGSSMPIEELSFPFPQTVEEYLRMPQDVRYRIARLLTLDSGSERERIMSDFSWERREVVPLQEKFATDQDFSRQIRATVAESDNRARVEDPRRR